MTKNLLITGATGFIGSNLLEELLKNNYEVTLLKRSFSDNWRIEHLLNNSKIDLKVYDIDQIELGTIFDENEISGILHLATYYRKYHTTDDISPMMKSNINFPIELIDLAVSHNVDFFINTGTFFEYDTISVPLSENSELNPFNFYAKTKIAFESSLKYYFSEKGINTSTMKIFSPYGPRDEEKKIIPHLILNLLKNNPVELSQGLQKLDFVYVKDITRAYLKLIENINNFDSYETFNIAGGFPYSIREIVSILEEITGSQLDTKWAEHIENENIIFSNINKSKEYLNWAPEYNIHEGLKETINYYRDKYDL
jgi:nucleoside-diphosphate-sugar epimerase